MLRGLPTATKEIAVPLDNTVSPILPATYDLVWSGGVLLLVAIMVFFIVQVFRRRESVANPWSWALAIIVLPVIGIAAWLVYTSITRRFDEGMSLINARLTKIEAEAGRDRVPNDISSLTGL